MTPQEALAQALWAHVIDLIDYVIRDEVKHPTGAHRRIAKTILDALPEGWSLMSDAVLTESLVEARKLERQQERERLRKKQETFHALHPWWPRDWTACEHPGCAHTLWLLADPDEAHGPHDDPGGYCSACPNDTAPDEADR